eukprot:TRINITY_DN7182_c0_g1_i1.p1 TRINITY_DN7182_c0_g1~~TRINITY_DN7182_c0_g1_i1.p1  ORF type:complete len:1274 (-),score=250.19 TRINITY_DN7182_c0_g1_i1:29-3439(-)
MYNADISASQPLRRRGYRSGQNATAQQEPQHHHAHQAQAGLLFGTSHRHTASEGGKEVPSLTSGSLRRERGLRKTHNGSSRDTATSSDPYLSPSHHTPHQTSPVDTTVGGSPTTTRIIKAPFNNAKKQLGNLWNNTPSYDVVTPSPSGGTFIGSATDHTQTQTHTHTQAHTRSHSRGHSRSHSHGHHNTTSPAESQEDAMEIVRQYCDEFDFSLLSQEAMVVVSRKAAYDKQYASEEEDGEKQPLQKKSTKSKKGAKRSIRSSHNATTDEPEHAELTAARQSSNLLSVPVRRDSIEVGTRDDLSVKHHRRRTSIDERRVGSGTNLGAGSVGLSNHGSTRSSSVNVSGSSILSHSQPLTPTMMALRNKTTSRSSKKDAVGTNTPGSSRDSTPKGERKSRLSRHLLRAVGADSSDAQIHELTDDNNSLSPHNTTASLPGSDMIEVGTPIIIDVGETSDGESEKACIVPLGENAGVMVGDAQRGVMFNLRDLSFATAAATGEGLKNNCIFRSACLSRGSLTEKDVKISLAYVTSYLKIHTIIDLRTKEEKDTDRFDPIVERLYPTVKFPFSGKQRKRFNVCFVNRDFKMKGVFWNGSPVATKMKMFGAVFDKDKRVKTVGEGTLNPIGLAGVNKLMLLYSYMEIVEALRIVSDPKNHPVLIHCASGKDRTGLISALILACCNVPDEDIIDNYALSEKYLAHVMSFIITENRDKGLNDTFDGTPASVMIETLEFIREKWGSVHNYLDEIGFSYEDQKGLVQLICRNPRELALPIKVSRKQSIKTVDKALELKRTKHHNRKVQKQMQEAEKELKILELQRMLEISQNRNQKYLKLIEMQNDEIMHLKEAFEMLSNSDSQDLATTWRSERGQKSAQAVTRAGKEVKKVVREIAEDAKREMEITKDLSSSKEAWRSMISEYQPTDSEDEGEWSRESLLGSPRRSKKSNKQSLHSSSSNLNSNRDSGKSDDEALFAMMSDGYMQGAEKTREPGTETEQGSAPHSDAEEGSTLSVGYSNGTSNSLHNTCGPGLQVPTKSRSPLVSPRRKRSPLRLKPGSDPGTDSTNSSPSKGDLNGQKWNMEGSIRLYGMMRDGFDAMHSRFVEQEAELQRRDSSLVMLIKPDVASSPCESRPASKKKEKNTEK